MRPAAVCNHKGPRRAAREAAGESARGGVEGGGGREIRRAPTGVCRGHARPPNARPAGGVLTVGHLDSLPAVPQSRYYPHFTGE